MEKSYYDADYEEKLLESLLKGFQTDEQETIPSEVKKDNPLDKNDDDDESEELLAKIVAEFNEDQEIHQVDIFFEPPEEQQEETNLIKHKKKKNKHTAEGSKTIPPKRSKPIVPKESKPIVPKRSKSIVPKESKLNVPKESKPIRSKESKPIVPKESKLIVPKESKPIRSKESKSKRTKLTLSKRFKLIRSKRSKLARSKRPKKFLDPLFSRSNKYYANDYGDNTGFLVPTEVLMAERSKEEEPRSQELRNMFTIKGFVKATQVYDVDLKYHNVDETNLPKKLSDKRELSKRALEEDESLNVSLNELSQKLESSEFATKLIDHTVKLTNIQSNSNLSQENNSDDDLSIDQLEEIIFKIISDEENEKTSNDTNELVNCLQVNENQESAIERSCQILGKSDDNINLSTSSKNDSLKSESIQQKQSFMPPIISSSFITRAAKSNNQTCNESMLSPIVKSTHRMPKTSSLSKQNDKEEESKTKQKEQETLDDLNISDSQLVRIVEEAEKEIAERENKENKAATNIGIKATPCVKENTSSNDSSRHPPPNKSMIDHTYSKVPLNSAIANPFGMKNTKFKSFKGQFENKNVSKDNVAEEKEKKDDKESNTSTSFAGFSFASGKSVAINATKINTYKRKFENDVRANVIECLSPIYDSSITTTPKRLKRNDSPKDELRSPSKNDSSKSESIQQKSLFVPPITSSPLITRAAKSNNQTRNESMLSPIGKSIHKMPKTSSPLKQNDKEEESKTKQKEQETLDDLNISDSQLVRIVEEAEKKIAERENKENKAATNIGIKATPCVKENTSSNDTSRHPPPNKSMIDHTYSKVPLNSAIANPFGMKNTKFKSFKGQFENKDAPKDNVAEEKEKKDDKESNTSTSFAGFSFASGKSVAINATKINTYKRKFENDVRANVIECLAPIYDSSITTTPKRLKRNDSPKDESMKPNQFENLGEKSIESSSNESHTDSAFDSHMSRSLIHASRNKTRNAQDVFGFGDESNKESNVQLDSGIELQSPTKNDSLKSVSIQQKPLFVPPITSSPLITRAAKSNNQTRNELMLSPIVKSTDISYTSSPSKNEKEEESKTKQKEQETSDDFDISDSQLVRVAEKVEKEIAERENKENNVGSSTSSEAAKESLDDSITDSQLLEVCMRVEREMGLHDQSEDNKSDSKLSLTTDSNTKFEPSHTSSPLIRKPERQTTKKKSEIGMRKIKNGSNANMKSLNNKSVKTPMTKLTLSQKNFKKFCNETTFSQRQRLYNEIFADEKPQSKNKTDYDDDDEITASQLASITIIEKQHQFYYEVKLEREKLMKEQIDYVSAKPLVETSPRIGLMLMKKSKPNRQTLRQYVNREKPYSIYLHRKISDITAYEFDMKNYIEGDLNALAFVSVADDVKLILNESSNVGFHEIKYSFLCSKGVDPKLASDAWIENAYKMIFRKFIWLENCFKNIDKFEVLSPENMLLQLKYRYDREIDRSERPALRKIFECDEAPGRRIILKVTDIMYNKCSGYELELSDGWYNVMAKVDSCTAELISKNKIEIGTKIIACNSEICGVSLTTGHDILDLPKSARFVIHGNSTRIVPWNSKLGFCKNPNPINVSVNSLDSNGGLVGRIRAVIVHVFNTIYVELVDGKREYRSEKVQNRIDNKKEITYCENYEKIREQVMKEVQIELKQRIDEINSKFKSLSDISHLSNNEICDVLEYDSECSLAMIIRTQLSESLLEKIHEIHAQRDFELNERIKSKMNDDTNKVAHMLKFRIVDFKDPKRTKLINWLYPPEDILDIVKIGQEVELRGLTPNPYLNEYSTNNTTSMKVVKKTGSIAKYEQFIRKETKFENIKRADFQPLNKEFDIACMVIHVEEQNKQKLCQEVFVADEKMNIVSVVFFMNLVSYAYDDMLLPGKILYIRNLEWRNSYHHIDNEIPEAFALIDCTTFVTSSGNESQMKRLLELQEFFENNPNYLSKCRDKLEDRIGYIHRKSNAQLKLKVLKTTWPEQFPKKDKKFLGMRRKKAAIYKFE